MRTQIFSLAAAMILSSQPVFASSVTQVALSPIAHADAALVVVGSDGGEVIYSPSDLEVFSTYSMTTVTPWRTEPATFEGVLLKDVLAASGLDGVNSISVTAENDYQTVINRAVWEEVEILVATRVDGRAHSRRARGPIQFVIDMDVFNASDITAESNLVWMAARIEPNE